MRPIVALVTVFSLSAAGSPEKPAQGGKPAVQKPGIRTPGIQIAFTNLKPEAEFQTSAKPEWLFFSGAAFAPSKDGIDRIDPKTNQKTGPIIGLAKACGGLASAFGSLWSPVCGTSSLARIDLKEFKVAQTLAIGVSDVAGTIASTADSIWMLTDAKTTLARIDPDQNTVVAEIRIPASCRSLIFGETALWLACPAENKVLRINPSTNLVDKAIEVSAQPYAITAGAGSVWVLCRKDGKVDRIDPKTDKVSRTIDLAVPNADGALAFGEGFLWVTQTGFPLARIDVGSETVLQQFYGEGGGAIAVAPGAIWLANSKASTIWRIDPRRVIAALPE